MKAEIIAVGTKLLLGDILNTNARFLSQQLSRLGIDVYYQEVVGDNPDRMKEVIDVYKRQGTGVGTLRGFSSSHRTTDRDICVVTATTIRQTQAVQMAVAMYSLLTRDIFFLLSSDFFSGSGDNGFLFSFLLVHFI